jgi:RNA polymerase sigma-70 factor (ECF subfamily)
MRAQTDAQLIAAARRGDGLAFARLVTLHQQAVRGFLRRACGAAAEADDLAQETFLTAWQRLGEYRGAASLRTWLCAIAFHKLQSARRSSARSRKRDGEYLLMFDQSTSPVDPGLHIALSKAMAVLPLDQRACVALCLAAGFSHAEAAQALEMPLGTVKSHVNRARERLLAALEAAP